MNKATKGALMGGLVVLTGPIGLIAVGIYFLRKQHDEQKRHTELLEQALNTSESR